MTKIDDERGLLDGVGASRKFVHAIEENENSKNIKSKSDKFNSSPNSKNTKSSLGYSRKSESSLVKPLSVAQQIRIASGYQQAVLKITSFGHGPGKVLAHLSYISRNFELPLEDQSQGLLISKDDTLNLIDTWKAIFFDEKANSRDTMNMVFSVPPNTSRETFKTLTREFLKEEFEGKHEYLFVQHDDTEHPHIHSVICMRSLDGKKLDPRKSYLHELRSSFAKKCREHNVMLDSSRRYQRGLSGKSTKSSLLQMKKQRGITPKVDQKLIENITLEFKNDIEVDTGNTLRAKRNEGIKNQFYITAKNLFEEYMNQPEQEREEKNIIASKLLLDYAKRFPKEITRGDFLKTHLKSQFEKGKKSIIEPSLTRSKSTDLEF